MHRQHRAVLRLWDSPDGPYLVARVMGVVWLVAANAMVLPLVYACAATAIELVIVGPYVRRRWRARTTAWERLNIERWRWACERVGIVNPPEIVRRPNGRLDARGSASSLTFTVEVDPVVKPQPAPAPKRAKLKLWGNDVAEVEVAADKPAKEPSGIVLRTLSDLAKLGEHFKVAMGGDVAEVRVHPLAGNRARVVVSFDVQGAVRREVRIGYDKSCTVLSSQPNRAWVRHAEFGGYVLAQHRHATEYVPEPGEFEPAVLELDDDEDRAWWVNGPDIDPQPSTTLDEPRSDGTDSDHEKEGCYDTGGGERLATPPWPVPNSAPVPMPPPIAA